MNAQLWERVCGLYLHKPTEQIIHAHFGLCLSAITLVWLLIAETAHLHEVRPIHLLWALHFLKVYPTEDIAANFFGTSWQTYHKWVWKVLGLLYLHLNVVM